MSDSRTKAIEQFAALGLKLKAAREAKGIGLGELSANIRINQIFLLQIENGELEKLPALTFLVSGRLDFHDPLGTFFVPRFSLMYRPLSSLTLRSVHVDFLPFNTSSCLATSLRAPDRSVAIFPMSTPINPFAAFARLIIVSVKSTIT